MIGSQRRRHNVFGYDERKKVKGKLCVSMLSFFSGVRFKKKKAVQDSSKLASGQAGSSVTPPRGLLMGLVCLIGSEIIDGEQWLSYPPRNLLPAKDIIWRASNASKSHKSSKHGQRAAIASTRSDAGTST